MPDVMQIASVLAPALRQPSSTHNFRDANSMLIAYVARRVSRSKADERYTFGYRRAKLIGVMTNLTLLGAM
jgi:cobalt-zinc-cadmium efflux system protein